MATSSPVRHKICCFDWFFRISPNHLDGSRKIASILYRHSIVPQKLHAISLRIALVKLAPFAISLLCAGSHNSQNDRFRVLRFRMLISGPSSVLRRLLCYSWLDTL